MKRLQRKEEEKEVKKASELKTNPILEKIAPPMHAEDFTELSNSLRNGEQLIPIDLMSDGETIIDGHHRARILDELGRPIKYKIHPEIKTLEQAIVFADEVNGSRRHENTFEKIEARFRRDQLITRKGRKNENIAEMIKTGSATVQRAIKIIEKGSEKLKQLVRDEKLSIYGAYRLVQALEGVPKETRKELEERVTDSDKPDEELMKVVGMIVETNAAKSLLELTSKEVAKKIEAKYNDQFYTEELDANHVKHDIQVAEGAQPKLKKIYLQKEKLKSEAEAEIYFKKFGGRFIKKAVVEMWIGEVDPYRYKEESEND